MSSRYQTTDFTMAKPCKNQCKIMIIWSHDLKAYTDLDTGLKHKCPNWNPKFQKPRTRGGGGAQYYDSYDNLNEEQTIIQHHNSNWRGWKYQ